MSLSAWAMTYGADSLLIRCGTLHLMTSALN